MNLLLMHTACIDDDRAGRLTRLKVPAHLNGDFSRPHVGMSAVVGMQQVIGEANGAQLVDNRRHQAVSAGKGGVLREVYSEFRVGSGEILHGIGNMERKGGYAEPGAMLAHCAKSITVRQTPAFRIQNSIA